MPPEEKPRLTESLFLDLYLVEQAPPPEDDRWLNCMFCRKSHDVDWETAYRPEGSGTLITVGVCERCRSQLKPFKFKEFDRADGFVHVDDFIDDHRKPAYARFVLDYFRRNAVCQQDFKPFMERHLLFCTWKEERFRVTGASRLGDIWLSADFKREVGYEHRVNVAECSEWSGQP